MEYKLLSEQIDQRQTYGIKLNENGKTIKTISDLSDDKESVIELISRLNELKVHKQELDYIIEDYLTSFSLT